MSYRAAVHVPGMWQEHPEIRCDAPDCAAVRLASEELELAALKRGRR